MRTLTTSGTAWRMRASIRASSGNAAPGDPVVSKVTTPLATPSTRISPPRAITDGSTLACSAAATLSARSTGTSAAVECRFQIGDEILRGLDADRQPQQVVGNRRGRPLHAAAMLDQAFNAAE